ncbi:MAG TPA: DUF4440 domain-containing protein [Edaphobacter sp.]|jgi:hypothetical protein|nr:DUF4440 domain-containing protein [Edaphobacter sp.]
MNPSELQDHLYTLEERLLHPPRERDRGPLIALLAEGFREYCSSGFINNREQAIKYILNSSARPASISHFYAISLAPDAVLVTYHATTSAHVSHRSSIWVLRDKRWQILFHQGTVAA